MISRRRNRDHPRGRRAQQHVGHGDGIAERLIVLPLGVLGLFRDRGVRVHRLLGPRGPFGIRQGGGECRFGGGHIRALRGVPQHVGPRAQGLDPVDQSIGPERGHAMGIEQCMQAEQQRLGARGISVGEGKAGCVVEHRHQAHVVIAHVAFGGSDGALDQRLRLAEPSGRAQHDGEIHARARHRHGVLTGDGRPEGAGPLRVLQGIVGTTGAETCLREIPEDQRQRIVRVHIGRTACQHVGRGGKRLGRLIPLRRSGQGQASRVVIHPVVVFGAHRSVWHQKFMHRLRLTRRRHTASPREARVGQRCDARAQRDTVATVSWRPERAAKPTRISCCHVSICHALPRCGHPMATKSPAGDRDALTRSRAYVGWTP